jgi:hypothetical protein
MDVNCQQSAGFCGSGMDRDRAQRRLRAVLCILAFAVQLVIPVVHMWEVAAQHTAITVAILAVPLPSGQTAGPTALSVRNARPHRLLHDTTICPVCQALTRIRDWLIARVEMARSVTAASRLVRFPLLPPVKFSRAVRVARAPPATS